MPPTQAVRRTVTTVAVLFAVLAGQGLALAGVQGAAPKTQPVTSGTFAVIATTAAGTPLPGPLTLTYAPTLLPLPQYFDAVNTGSLTLTATSYGVAISGGGALSTPTIALSACVGGTWDTANGTCSGTTTPISSWTSVLAAPFASNVAPLAAGTRLGIKASLSSIVLLSANTVAVITTTVSSSGPRQIRAATTSNS